MTQETIRLIGEMIGIVAIVEGFLIYLSNKRDKILIFKFISDALWLFNQLCLGGYTGALLNLIAMGREGVFYFRDKKAFASSRFWLYFFLSLTLVSPIISLVAGGEGWYAVLPALGSMAAVIGFYSRSPRVTRLTSLAANSLWLIYDAIISNYSALLSCAILLLSAIVGMIASVIRKKRQENREE